MICKRIVLTILTTVALSLATSTATAAIYTFDANFDGLQMAPPNASPAFGLASATLDDSSGTFTIISGSYNGLLGGSIAVILGDAPPGMGGPTIFGLTNDTPGATTGTFSGGGVLSGPQMTDMLADNTFILIRSQVFPSGEIRGQLIKTPEPSTLVLAGFAALGLLAAAWRRRRRAAA